MVCVDLNNDQIIKQILFPQDVALSTTYLNDVRFDLRRGKEGMAFITDSAQKGPNGIIVVDLHQEIVGANLMIIHQQRQRTCKHFFLL